MALINWEEKFQVNLNLIDNQHKKLVAILNRLHESMSKGKGSEVLESVIKDLITYTKTHFADEEKLMIENKYSQYDSHYIEHSNFITKVEQVYNDLSAGKIGLSMELMYFLKNWLLNHIMVVDKKFGDFMQTKSCA